MVQWEKVHTHSPITSKGLDLGQSLGVHPESNFSLPTPTTRLGSQEGLRYEMVFNII